MTPSIGYRVGGMYGTKYSAWDIDLFAPWAAKDAGLRCCLIHSCCWGGFTHSTALGWVSPRLGEVAKSAAWSELRASALRSASNRGPKRRPNPFLQTFAVVEELRADEQYSGVRGTLRNLLFGTWKASDDGEIFLAWPPPTPFKDVCTQCWCPVCARVQELDSVMRWREREESERKKRDVKLRFQAPWVCTEFPFCDCGIEEQLSDGTWRLAASTPPEMWLKGKNLLGRDTEAPVPLLAMARE